MIMLLHLQTIILSTRNHYIHFFQAFTSSSRSRVAAEMFGNVVFIMSVRIVFPVDRMEFDK